jgi:hypothetical protein
MRRAGGDIPIVFAVVESSYTRSQAASINGRLTPGSRRARSSANEVINAIERYDADQN